MSIFLVLLLVAVAITLWALSRAPARRAPKRRRPAPSQTVESAQPTIAAPSGKQARTLLPPSRRSPERAASSKPGHAPDTASAAAPLPAPEPVPGVIAEDTTALPIEELPPAPDPNLPPELAAFKAVRPAELDESRRGMLLDSLRRVPRPSRAFHRLASPDVVAEATSAELGVLVSAEPQIAGKVLSTVNSPLFNLQRPVQHLGQAITFLGLNSIRAICMRYILEESFTPSSFEQKRLFDSLWQASTLACELCYRLAQKLGMNDAGALMTPMVLCFLGRFGCAALLPQELALPLSHEPALIRMRAEQLRLGLASPALTELLLREWLLPEPLIDDVRAIDEVMLRPADPQAAERDARLGLCWFSARLAERIATGPGAVDLSTATQSDAPESYHFASYLALPGLARLPEMLQSADIVRLVRGLQIQHQSSPA